MIMTEDESIGDYGNQCIRCLIKTKISYECEWFCSASCCSFTTRKTELSKISSEKNFFVRLKHTD